MRRLLEIGAFVGMSVAVHAAVLGQLPMTGATGGQGTGGQSRATLQAAPDSVSAMVNQWQRPPHLQGTQPLALIPPLPEMPGGFSIAASDAPPRLDQRAPPDLATPDRLVPPMTDTTTPPPPQLAAAPTLRPTLRPEAPAPVAAPPPASTPAPARIAAGSGGGAVAGTAPAPTTAPAAGLSTSARNTLMAQWGGRIQARIERSRPRVSASGRVVIALRITPTGQLAGLSVAQSSGDAGLDQAAVSAVQRARLPAAPDGLTDASYAFSLPVRFQ